MDSSAKEEAWKKIIALCENWESVKECVVYEDISNKLFELRKQLTESGVDLNVAIDSVFSAYAAGVEAVARYILHIATPVEWEEKSKSLGIPCYDGKTPIPLGGEPRRFPYCPSRNTSSGSDENVDDFDSSNYDSDFYNYKQTREYDDGY